MPEELNFSNLRNVYTPDKYILVLPTVSHHLASHRQDWSLDVTTVKIDPGDKNLVYPIDSKWDNKRREHIVLSMGLTKVALDLIASAADVNADPNRIDAGSNPLYACYKAIAVMRTPGGDVRGRSASVEWDGTLMKEKIEFKAREYIKNAVANKWEGKSPLGIRFCDLTPQQADECIELRFTRQWIDEREFGKRKAESKAARNAIRALLALPSTYTPRDLHEKEFAIAKFIYTPDMSDPQVRAAMIEAGRRAQQHLYGFSAASAAGGSFLPSEIVPPTMALPAGPPEGASEAADDPADPVEAEAEIVDDHGQQAPEIDDEISWVDVKDRVDEISGIIRTWPGDDDAKNRIALQFGTAVANKSPYAILQIYNTCLDLKLEAEDRGGR